MRKDTNSFTRHLLALVVVDVKKHIPGIKLREAWAYRAGKGQWEFRWGEHHWEGKADDSYEARAKGWASVLRARGVEGYAIERPAKGV